MAKTGVKRARTPTRTSNLDKETTDPKEAKGRKNSPLYLYKRWTGSVSTDGIVAHWYLNKPQNKGDKKTKNTKSKKGLATVDFVLY